MTPDQAITEVERLRTRFNGCAGVNSATGAEAAEVLADEVTRLRCIVAHVDMSTKPQLERIVKLTMERNAYRRIADKADPMKTRKLAKEFEEQA